MHDDYIVRFRRKVEKEAQTSAKYNDIIAQSLSKTYVKKNESNNAILVTFINDDKEGATESIMYSYAKDTVAVGDYINFLDDNYLVYKEIKNLKRENYIDAFRLVMCNILFNFGGVDVKAYFRGALRTQNSDEVNLAGRFGVDSSGEAMIMVPASLQLGVNTPITIKGKGWRTLFVDDNTNPGTKYITLEEFMIVDTSKTSENETIDLTPPPVVVPVPELIAGLTYTFDSEGGYIKTNPAVKIVSRSNEQIKFIIPFGIENITIDTKVDGIIESMYYKIRG